MLFLQSISKNKPIAMSECGSFPDIQSIADEKAMWAFIGQWGGNYLMTDDGKLAVGDVFLDTTLKNINANGGKIAISVYNAETLEGYQIKGKAEYLTNGEMVDTFKAMVEKMFNGAATAKGALVITPEKVIVTTPGVDNKREI